MRLKLWTARVTELLYYHTLNSYKYCVRLLFVSFWSWSKYTLQEYCDDRWMRNPHSAKSFFGRCASWAVIVYAPDYLGHLSTCTIHALFRRNVIRPVPTRMTLPHLHGWFVFQQIRPHHPKLQLFAASVEGPLVARVSCLMQIIRCWLERTSYLKLQPPQSRPWVVVFVGDCGSVALMFP